MSFQISDNLGRNTGFWSNATKYASSSKNDEDFVSELAYVMVTLHRTGA